MTGLATEPRLADAIIDGLWFFLGVQVDRAEPSAVDEAMRILELAPTAHLRFKRADSEQKRELLKFVVSNSSWVDGKLEVELHEFFDLMLNLVKSASQNENETVDNGLANVKSGHWWR